MKSGFLCIDKTSGMTSHDVVSKLRKILNMKKIGHSGTLDPMATGVMIVGFGTSTRLLDYVQSGNKEYIADISFGIKTSTGDMQGEVIESCEMVNLNEQDLALVIKKFIGSIEQIPPMVSAIKIDGKKLYEYEREGRSVERKPRKVEIFDIELLQFSQSQGTKNVTAKIRVVCSPGTYIRTLAEDIAKELGGFAHLVGLRRTKNGKVDVDNCISIEQLAKEKDPFSLAIEPVNALSHLLTIDLNESQTLDVSHGKRISLDHEQQSKLNLGFGDFFIARTQYSPNLVAVFDSLKSSGSLDIKSRCVVFLE